MAGTVKGGLGLGGSASSGGTPTDASIAALERLADRGFMGGITTRLLASARAKQAKQKKQDALLTSAPVTTPQTASDDFVKARQGSERVRRQARTLFGGDY